MSRSNKLLVLTLAAIALIGVLRFKPWQHKHDGGEQKLQVGFLPVT